MLTAFKPNGAVDATIGAAPPDSNAVPALARKVLPPSGGRLLVVSAGQDATGNYAGPLVIARYDAMGRADATFGNVGRIVTGVVAGSASLQPDGRLLVSDEVNGNFTVARYTVT